MALITQCPIGHPQVMNGSHLMTLISNAPVMWVKSIPENIERFLHPVEMLLSLGFPCLELYAPYNAPCSFQFPNSSRTRASQVEQAGNSMAIVTIAKALVWVASQVSFPDQAPAEAAPMDDFLASFI